MYCLLQATFRTEEDKINIGLMLKVIWQIHYEGAFSRELIHSTQITIQLFLHYESLS